MASLAKPYSGKSGVSKQFSKWRGLVTNVGMGSGITHEICAPCPLSFDTPVNITFPECKIDF